MASKRRFSYQWRIFVPLLLGLWIVIFILGLWQMNREQEMRREMINDQLMLAGERVANTYGVKSYSADFMRFLHQYYDKNERYDNIRISIYDAHNDSLVYNMGVPFTISQHYITNNENIISGDEVTPPLPETQDYFYNYTLSENGKYKVYLLLTDYPEFTDQSNKILTSFWITIVVLTLVIIVASFAISRYLSKNIRILRRFAKKANSKEPIDTNVKFANDELGDVFSEIITLYVNRVKETERSEREHQVAMHALEEKTLIKRQMSNNINHELKTPIGIIKGYLDTIISNPDMDEDTKNHFINKSAEHITRLTQLIKDLSTITKLEDGKQNIETEALNYHDLVYTFNNDITESGLLGDFSFEFNIPLDCVVIGNEPLLESMLLNLTKNAIAYSNGTQCGIKLIRKDDKFYHFKFYDNGTGVATEHLSRLFERFYRVDKGRDRRTGGTGLGLPIVYNTIVSLGGNIEVRNRSPHGLEFIFSIPHVRINRTEENAANNIDSKS